MKALILSITAGQGHNSTGKAICNYFEQIGVESRMLDTYAYLNKLLGKTVANGYLLSITNARGPYARTYKMLEHRNKNGNDPSATRTINKMLTRKLKKYIDIYDPDVIICTHIFAGILVDILKQKHSIRSQTIGILTDFAFHPYWEESIHFDYIITPDQLLRTQALKKGFHDEQIKPFGIPINPKFMKEIDKAEAKAQLGLDPDLPVVTLMSGSMGYGHLTETVAALDRNEIPFQIVAVCGSNQKAKEAMDAMPHTKPMTVYGFADNVEVIMSASDCLITKPGGLSSSEALAKRLPMIIMDPIPGQEERNTEFLLNAGCAVQVTETFPLEEAIYSLLADPRRLELIKQSMDLIRKPDSTVRLCEFARDIVLEHSEE